MGYDVQANGVQHVQGVQIGHHLKTGRGGVCPGCRKGHTEAFGEQNVDGKSYADSKLDDKSGLGPGQKFKIW